MRANTSRPGRNILWRSIARLALNLLLALSLTACSLMQSLRPTPTPTATRAAPTGTTLPTRQPVRLDLPPALLAADPPAGSTLPLLPTLTLSFSQPMDRRSVEAALRGDPQLSGRFDWPDESTLRFTPDRPLEPGQNLRLEVTASAKAANGQPLTAPLALEYQAAPPLALTAALPANNTREVDPSGALTAAFNQPVVALGADAAGQPPAFTLEPSAPGSGEWLNTSTYVFHPQPSLDAGRDYIVRLAPDLRSLYGAPLSADSPREWRFTTAVPRLVSIDPFPPALARLDGPISLTFNVAMDTASVERSLRLEDPTGARVAGSLAWSNGNTTATFAPSTRLQRATAYTLRLSGQAAAQGGIPLGTDIAQAVNTYPALSVIASDPAAGGTLANFNGFAAVQLTFSAPLQPGIDPGDYLAFTPAVSDLFAFIDEQGQLNANAYFQPNTGYTLRLSADLPDAWGGTLGAPYELAFLAPSAQPALLLPTATLGSPLVFLTPSDPGLAVQATNLTALQVTVAPIALEDLLRFTGPGGYEALRTYAPASPVNWTQALALPANSAGQVSVPLTPDGQPLPSGLYYVAIQASELNAPAEPFLVSVSANRMALKMGTDQAFVWAAGQPNRGVRVLSEEGQVAAEGSTGADGVFTADLPALPDPYQTFLAISGQPGSADYALASSAWSQGISGWDFDLPVDLTPPGPRVYAYTDRPVYQPGQTVSFKAVIRNAANGRYSLPAVQSIRARVLGEPGLSGDSPLIASLDLPLSAFGSAHSQVALPEQAAPGMYRIEFASGDALLHTLFFEVAEYRKPQIELFVSLSPDQLTPGQATRASLQASYYFGAPAAGLPVRWQLFSLPDPFALPQYQVGALAGPLPAYWSSPASQEALAGGEGRTGADGSLEITLAAPDRAELRANRQRLRLEVTVEDGGGARVTASAEAGLHPGGAYIGIRPEAWSVEAGNPMGFSLQTVDWQGAPAGGIPLEARFERISWRFAPSAAPGGIPGVQEEVSPAGSASPVSDAGGLARVAFTPPEPGAYRLSVSGAGATSQALVWVGGAGSVTWAQLPNQHLPLSPDAAAYRPGDSARLFIPNPFGRPATALVSVERGRVMRWQVLAVDGSSLTLPLELTADDAPNVYVSVLLLDSARPDFRIGYANLAVAPDQNILNIELSGLPEQARPGQEVTLNLRATDSGGRPAQAEFSLALADLAALAVAPPNAPGIVQAFYGVQPLGVRTALDLAGYAWRSASAPPGGGGGGDGMEAGALRQNFEDTAFWQAQITTGADGTARVTLTLPDNLTTWQADARAITTATQVGAATARLVTTQELIVQPQLPPYLVAGDHFEIAALAHNNTGADQPVDVTLQAAGFTLDAGVQPLQTITVPAGGQARVGWWGTVQAVDRLQVTFTARSGALLDATTPEQGAIPVIRYARAQTFSTAGVLAEAGEALEVVALPSTPAAADGLLRLELSPSIAAAILADLSVLEQNTQSDSASLVSGFLPALVANQALRGAGVINSDLQQRLDARVPIATNQLLARQQPDGSWTWWQGGTNRSIEGDSLISAYVYTGLSLAAESGYNVPAPALERARAYLEQNAILPAESTPGWQLDRLAFTLFALRRSRSPLLERAGALYDLRAGLSPSGQAFLALALSEPGVEDARVATLLADLAGQARRTATGSHWQTDPASPRPESPLLTSAMVLFALGQLDPASPVVADGLRYLMAGRARLEDLPPSIAGWMVMALAEVMQGTGDLQSSFNYSATLNGRPFAAGQAGGAGASTGVTVSARLDELDPGGNALTIERGEGIGRLYYRADLTLYTDAGAAAPLDQGINLSRAYRATTGCPAQVCPPVTMLPAGEPVEVTLTLTVPEDQLKLVVRDHLPAGVELLDARPQRAALQAPWPFNPPTLFADHILWSADFLPAGSYTLVYRVVPRFSGEFYALPARAWQDDFPEVQGASAGMRISIRPAP